MADRQRPRGGLDKLVDILFGGGSGGQVKRIRDQVRVRDDNIAREANEEQQLEQPQGGGTRKVGHEDQPKKKRNIIDLLFN